MKGFFVAHVEKVVFAAVAVVCLGILIWGSGTNPEEKDIVEKLGEREQKIKEALEKNRPDSSVVPAFDQAVARWLEGPRKMEPMTFAPHAAYPLLPKPVFPEAVKVKPTDEGAKPPKMAVLRAPVNAQATADRGRIYISYEPSPENREVVNVRMELEVSQDGGATWTVAAKEEFNPEELAAPEAKVDEKKGEEGVEKTRVRPKRGDKEEGDEEHAVRPGRRDDKEKDGGKKKVTAKDEFKNKYVFLYQDVKPKKTYHFRIQEVVRVEAPKAGERVLEPQDCTRIETATKRILFVSQPSASVSATTPADVEIRFAGSIGELNAAGFQGNFEVRKWDPALRDWRRDTVVVGKGERIRKEHRYRDDQTNSVEVIDLDSGYTFTDVEETEVETTKEVDQPVMQKVQAKDEDGKPLVGEDGKPVMEDQPVMDPKTKQPVMEKVKKTMKMPTQVAVLTESGTNKVEKIPKRGSFEARQQYLQYIEQVLKEREEEAKDRAKRLQAGKDRAVKTEPKIERKTK